MIETAEDENAIVISREIVYRNSRSLAKNAANLNILLYLLEEKSYVNFQKGGKSGRKQYIVLNPSFF